jgi:hypothetical protein
MFCEVCNKHFTRVFNFERHKESQKHLMKVENQTQKVYICPCGNEYLYRQSYHRHKKVCTFTPEIQTVTETENDNTENSVDTKDMIREIEAMKKQLELLLEKCDHPPPPSSSQINNNTTNTNSHNTTNNLNLQINAFGQENLDYITDGILHNCVNRVFESIPTLIEKIHFDPAHPENHTIKIPNKKLPHASVMSKDKQWKLMNKHDVIDNIMNNGYNMIDDKFNEDPSKFTEDRRKQYRRYQEKYDTEDKETMKRIKTDVEMVLINGTKSIHSQKKCV